MSDQEIERAFASLQTACRILESAGEHDIAAITSHAMALIIERHGIGDDHMIDPTS